MTKQVIVERADLFCKQGSKDAVYHIEIVQDEDGFLVNYRNGRAGGTLTPGTKTKSRVSEEAARKVFDRTVKEKLKAQPPYQYMAGATGDRFTDVAADVAGRATGLLPLLLNDVESEAEREELLRSDAWGVQQKYDGQKRMVRSLGDGSTPIGAVRKGGEVALPVAIAESVANITCVIDAEIIGERLYVYDLLELDGVDLRAQALSVRNERLMALAGSFGPAIVVSKVITGEAAKRAFVQRAFELEQEGVVFVRLAAPYVPGRPASGGDKRRLKFWKDATTIVLGCKDDKRSVEVGVLRIDGDSEEMVAVGAVTVPVNAEIPEPGSLLDVKYLYCIPGGSLFIATFKCERKDLDRRDACYSALKFKADHAEVAANDAMGRLAA